MSYISERARIEHDVLISDNVQIYGATTIKTGTIVGPGCVIGFPIPEHQRTLNNKKSEITSYSKKFDSEFDCEPVIIGPRSHLRSNVVIYGGVSLGENTDTGHFIMIRERSLIGPNSHITSGAQIMADVTIGENCRIAGTICNRSKIGSNSVMLGHMMHSYSKGLPGLVETSPEIGIGVLVGREASVIGGIEICDYGVLGAGSVLTKSMPTREIWTGNPAKMTGVRSSEVVVGIQNKMSFE